MMASRPDVWLEPLGQVQIDLLRDAGVTIDAAIRPTPILKASGAAACDGLFEHDPQGECWMAFEEPEDFVFWQPRRSMFATLANRAFALGGDMIDNPGTYSFDCALNIYDHPLDWLRAKRDGIVVLPRQWHRAFDLLRDAPRIALAESLLPTYRRFMKPAHMPELSIIPGKLPAKRRAA